MSLIKLLIFYWILVKIFPNIGYYIIDFFYNLYYYKLKLYKINQTNILVSGSYGKSTTTKLIYHILSQNYKCKLIDKNSRFSIPLMLMGIDIDMVIKINYPLLRWPVVYFLLLIHLIFYIPKNKINIIEIGIDKLTGMKYHLRHLPLADISSLTAIDEVHLSGFFDINQIIEEKFKLLLHTKKGGLSIINNDNIHILNNKEKIKNKVLKVANKNCSCIFTNMNYSIFKFNGEILNRKYQFNININNIQNNQIFGKHHSTNLGIAIYTALYLSVPQDKIINQIKNFKIPRGRDSFFKLDNLYIFNSSYNSFYYTCQETLITCLELNLPLILILGDMAELGSKNIYYHQKLGNFIKSLDSKIDKIYLIGKNMKEIVLPLLKSSNKCYHFDNITKLNKSVNLLNKKKESLIFIKGSNSNQLWKLDILRSN